MKKLFTLITVLGFGVLSFVVLTVPANAGGFLPDPLKNLLDLLGPGGEGTSEFIQSRVSALLLIFLGVIILAAVVYTAFAALKYIRSQGEEGEVETAKKGIEAIFQGIAVMLIAIVGIVLIFVFFGADLFAPSLFQTCIAGANSPGCNACTDQAGGLADTWDDAKFAQAPGFTVGVGGVIVPVAIGGTFMLEYNTPLPPGLNQEKLLCGACEWAYFQTSRDNTAARPMLEVGGSLYRICTE